MIPELSEDIEFHILDKNHYLLQNLKFGHQLKISNNTYYLLQLIDGKNKLSDISEKLKILYDIPLEVSFIYELLYKKLSNYGVLKNNNIIKKRERSSYLRASFILFKQEYVEFFSRLFSIFFSPKIFYSFLILLILTTLIFILSDVKLATYEITNWKSLQNAPILIFLLFIFSLIHELGHSTACRKLGARHGGIGFGFYLFMPVFFADVSDAWKLKPSSRIIIDLAGVFMELIFCNIIIVAYLLSESTVLIHFLWIALIKMIINLNPFFRYDGYWVLSDMIEVPNLRRQSLKKVALFLKYLGGKVKRIEFSKKDWGLFFYGLISTLIIIIFLSYMIIIDPSSLVTFPYDAYLIIKYLFIKQQFPELEILSGFIQPILFYYLVFRNIKSFLRKINMSEVNFPSI